MCENINLDTLYNKLNNITTITKVVTDTHVLEVNKMLDSNIIESFHVGKHKMNGFTVTVHFKNGGNYLVHSSRILDLS